MLHECDITVDFSKRDIKYHNFNEEKWKITMIDTGLNTMTGSRLKKVLHLIKEDDFCMTYGDGLSNVNIRKLIEFHKSSDKLATLTAVKPPGRFGSLILKNNIVKQFTEKPLGDGSYINGGFFVLNKKIAEYIPDGDFAVWENEPLYNLSKNNQLAAFKHDAFWRPLDTLRDKIFLENLWDKGKVPWLEAN